MSKIKLDDLDHQILQILNANCRTPFTDIAKKLIVSAGTVHIRVKKMEEMGVITGSTLVVDYGKLNYNFIAYVGLFVDNTSSFSDIVEEMKKVSVVTSAHLTTGKFALFCKIRAKNTEHAKEVIFNLGEIKGVIRTETFISLEEVISDKQRLMEFVFSDENS